MRVLLLAAGAAALMAAAAPRAAAARPHPVRDASPDTMTSSFDVHGVHVILRRNAANDVVAANLYLLGGTRESPDSLRGVEPMMLWVSEFGTRHYSREALRRRTAELGSTIVVEPRPDWTVFGFRGIRATFDSTWMLFADRLTEPTFDSSAVALVKAQVLSAVRQRRDSPDDLLQYLADSIGFTGSSYGVEPAGTEQSIAAVTAAQLRRFRDTALVTSRMLLVVVGNVERAHLERLISATIGRLPHGSYVWTPPPPPDSLPAAAVMAERTLPTNYILGYYEGPRATSPDFQALRVAAAVLGGRLFTEIRSRRNLTYAVDAPFVEHANAAGGLYVTTVYPDSALAIMRAEVHGLQEGLIDEDNLHLIVAQFLTEYYLNNETNAEQAKGLARAQLYRGDWHVADDFADELRRVTPSDVRRAARTYMRRVRWAYVGDTTKVSRALLESF